MYLTLFYVIGLLLMLFGCLSYAIDYVLKSVDDSFFNYSIGPRHEKLEDYLRVKFHEKLHLLTFQGLRAIDPLAKYDGWNVRELAEFREAIAELKERIETGKEISWVPWLKYRAFKKDLDEDEKKLLAFFNEWDKFQKGLRLANFLGFSDS